MKNVNIQRFMSNHFIYKSFYIMLLSEEKSENIGRKNDNK